MKFTVCKQNDDVTVLLKAFFPCLLLDERHSLQEGHEDQVEIGSGSVSSFERGTTNTLSQTS